MFDGIVAFLESSGPFGVALLMFLENVFPPIPSELVMPLAGFSAARGDGSLLVMIVAGTVGSVAGATLWYLLGLKLGGERLKRLARRHGRWITLSPDEIERAEAWFHRHGRVAVLAGRLFPAVRTLISVPAGIARMPLGPFLAYSTLGSAIWTALLAGAGFLLEGQYEKVSTWLNPVSNVVVIALVGWYAYRVATFHSTDRD